MGTRIGFLGWVPYQGLDTPFFARPSMMATSSTTVGAGTGEPQQRLRVDASFHRSRESRCGKGTGVF
jgi:hypothetical protein